MTNTTPQPCERCLSLAFNDQLRVEAVQPIPAGAKAPLARDTGKPCCYDCAAADGLVAWFTRDPNAPPIKSARWRAAGRAPRERESFNFPMARICVANARQEQYRLPGVSLGLVAFGIVRPSEPGDLDRHLEWQRAVGLFVEFGE